MAVKINNVNYNTIPEQVVVNKNSIGALETRVGTLESQGSAGFSVNDMRVKLKENDTINFADVGMLFSTNKWLLLTDLTFQKFTGQPPVTSEYAIPKGEWVQFSYNGADGNWKVKSTAKYMNNDGTMKEFEVDVTGESIAFTGTILQFLAS